MKRLSEDWVAFFLACLLFGASLLSFAGLDPFFWFITVQEWSDPGKGLATLGKVGSSPILSLLLSYLFLLLILSPAILLLGGNLKRFTLGFTGVFLLSFLCWFLGHNAYLASTDPRKSGVPWSLRLTGEAGFILALGAGLLIGNLFPRVARFLEEAVRPELYIKTAIGLMGALLGIKSAESFGLASAVLFRGLCAIVEAYLLYWALVYFVARRYFRFSREWAAPLASGISICGVSAAIATGGAIKARPIVPIMVSSLVVIFAVMELLILPFFAQMFLWKEPMVAGAWMGLAVKTDGAAFASGAIVEALIRSKTEALTGVHYDSGWILMTATTTKLFIDLFISIWAFLLAVLWCTHIERRPGEKVSPELIWERFPKFILAYALTFGVMLLLSLPLTARITPVENQVKRIEKELARLLEGGEASSGHPEASRIPTLVAEKQALLESISREQKLREQAKRVGAGTNALRTLFFLFTFFTIGVITNFRKLREEGIGRLALVYFVCLFGFILWIGLFISWIFFHGVKPPLLSG